jgi:TetR/AcrR family transcriptional regulator, transcriptional repressor for nem operon
MPRVSREQTDKNRLAIEAASVRLFKQYGINGVSVSDIMACAGLTHGGFYGHFESKDELAAIACAKSFEQSVVRWKAMIKDDLDEAGLVNALADHYLSEHQRDEPGEGCPITGLATDASREAETKPVRKVYAQGLKSLIDILVSFSRTRQSKAVRQRALARLSTLVGALTLARAVRGDPLSEEILAAARESLRAEVK